MKKVLGTLGLLVVLTVGGVIGIYGTQELMALVSGSEDGSGEQSRPPTRVTVTGPEERTLDNAFQTTASLLPLRSVELRPLSSGRVVEVAVQSGATVEEGDLIFRLDSRAAEAMVEERRATLIQTRADFQRLNALASENVAAQANVEEALAAFRRAEANLAMAEADLEDRMLTAPFSGVIGIIDLDPGEYIDTASSITELDDISVVQADLSLPERYFDAAQVGQKVNLTGTVYDDRTFTGEIVAKAPRIDEGSRSFALRARIENADGALASGMFMTANLVFGTFNALTLADDAIISEGNATYVYVVEDETAARTDIRLGQRQGGRTAVLAGLEPEAQVVLTGYATLRDGAPVEIVEREATGEAVN